MTGFSSKDVAIKALIGKADNYVEKPFDIKVLRATVEKELRAGLGEEKPADMDIAGKIAHVRWFLEGNSLKKVTLQDAASIVFLTPKYLSRLFSEYTGVSFNQYKLKVKMDHAKRLLSSPGHTVKEISAKLGYANAESFVRQFKKIVKTTPSCYRNNHRCKP